MLQKIVYEIAFLAILFFVGLALSRLLVPISERLAVPFGVVDHPNNRKVHTRVIPRMGGLAIALALILTLLFCVQLDHGIVRAFLAGAALIVLLGLADDIVGLPPWVKFSGEILAALAFLQVGGFSLESFGDLFGFGEVRTGFLAVPVTIFCMIGLMNALNLSDGLDGLAGGISFIACLFLAVLAYEARAWYWVSFPVALLGVLLGFLRFNQHPASLFMGDTGSLLLGYSVAAISVGLTRSLDGSLPVQPMNMAILLALPVVDTLFVMGRRLVNGKAPFSPDKSHFHHRLLRLGLNHAGVVSLYYLLMLCLATIAWYSRALPEWWRFYGGLAAFAFMYGGLSLLERRKVDLGRWFDSFRIFRKRSRRLPDRFTAALSSGGALLCSLALFLPLPALLGRMPRTLGLFALTAALFVALLFPWSGKRKRLPLGHGVLYLACFSLLLIYFFVPARPAWVMPHLYGTAAFAFLSVLLLVAGSRRSLVLYPSGFEILLLLLSWAVSLVVLPMLGVNGVILSGTVQACFLALPLFCFGKLAMGRRPAANIGVAVAFILLLFFAGASSF